MAINDTEELTLTSSYAGQVLVNTFHFRLKSLNIVPPVIIEQALIDQWQAACQVAYLDILKPHVVMNTISARQVCGSPPLRARIDESLTAPGTNGAVSAAAAPWLAALTRERSAFAGKSYQGRNFYPVTDETEFNGVNVEAAKLAKITTYNTALMTAFGPSGTSGDFQLVIHSPTRAKLPGIQCQDCSTPVLSLSVSPFLTTMRSRRSRSGA